MDASIAQAIARRVHAGHVTRFDEPMIEHVERVARAVPDEARALAYLHDVLERSDLTLHQLRDHGLTGAERSALELLTRHADQSYEDYILGIALAKGRVGAIARSIKLADLDDHLSHRPAAGAPDYRWARRQVVRGSRRRSRALHAGQRRVIPAPERPNGGHGQPC